MSKKSFQNYFKYIRLAILIGVLIWIYQFFDINFINDNINNILENSQTQIINNGIYIALLIFLLRSFSIIIPLIPGTYCAVIAGYIYGIKSGLILMFIADLSACSSSFFISRYFGRDFVKKLLGSNQIRRIEHISQQYLEDNFFLMTSFLMTSWFDFVCYAVGLTKLKWVKFMPALIVSILISDLPFVAGGYTISKIKDIGISQILTGEVSVLRGPYLLILIMSALIIFVLGIINILIKKRTKIK